MGFLHFAVKSLEFNRILHTKQIFRYEKIYESRLFNFEGIFHLRRGDGEETEILLESLPKSLARRETPLGLVY